MIGLGKYKDREAVIVESGRLRATFLPRDGAKMASLIDRRSGRELLATKDGETYRVLDYEGSYVDSECSAFDDMFPTIDPYTPTEGAYAGLTYPDHGECCRIGYSVQTEGESVTFTARSPRFLMQYRKTVSVEGDRLDLHYVIENEGDADFPFVWAGHIMLRGEDGMCLCTPFAPDAPIEMMFATEGYAPETLPRDRLTGFVPDRGAAYKFYYLDRIPEGRFRVRYADGRELCFLYDETKIPYLGVWLNNGEFQGIYNLAPEPCTVPFDAPHKAAERGYSSVIPAHEKLDFHIYLSLQEGE